MFVYTCWYSSYDLNLEYRSESISISISYRSESIRINQHRSESISINQNQSVYRSAYRSVYQSVSISMDQHRSATISIDHIIQRYKEGSEITLKIESYTRSFGSLFGCLFFEVTNTTTTINHTHCVPSSFLTSQGTAGCVGGEVGTCL